MAAAFLAAAASEALASGSISGHLKDSGTNAALVGAQVLFHDFNNDAVLAVATATTDASGNYTQNLPDGTYAVLSHAGGTYINQLWQNLSCSAVCNIGPNGSLITTITISGGNNVTGIDFALVSGGGRVSGKVTSAAGAPLAGVTVFMLDSQNGVPFASGVTGADGTYTTEGGSVTGNVFVVTLNTLGYQDESYNDHKCPNMNCPATPDLVAVMLGSTTPNINFALDPGGRISGKVTDANGSPLANVRIHIADSTRDVDLPMTDGSGNFISTGLAAGTYYAGTENSAGYVDKVWTDLTCPGNWCTPTNGTPISVTVSNTTTGINFALTSGAPISGTVTAAAGGAPIANAEVDIFDATGNAVTGASTNNTGAYTTPALPTGEYFAAISFRVPTGFVGQLYNHMSCPNNNCAFTSGTPIPLTANTPVTNINFSLLATGNGSITGHVTDSTLTGVIAQVVLVGMNGIQQVATVNSIAGTGAYTFSNVAAGSYYVRTNSSSLINKVYPNIVCLSCNSMTSGGQLVTVTNGVATGPIDFALDAGGHISGTITNAAGGAPIANIGVQIFNAAGLAIDGGRVSANGSGVYTSSGLPPGTYYARTTNIQGFINKQWNGLDCPQTSCLPTAGTPIVVSGTATASGIDFSLTMGGRISGTLTDATTHAPITFMGVTLFSSVGVNLGQVNSDGSGNYTSQGLPPGTYYARTATSTFFLNNQLVGYIDQLWNGMACVPACLSPTTGTPIAVTSASTTTGVNFNLTAAGSVSGTVVDAGAPTTGLASIGVQIYTAAGAFAKATTTNTVGGYTVGGLPAGTYYARTSSGSNQFYQDELYREMPCGSGCAVTAGTPITVPPLGMASGVDFTLSSGAGSISGTVTDAVTSAALPAVTVQIYASDGTFVKSANTNITGAFAFGGLTPGTYYARTAVISGSIYVDQVFDGKVCAGTCVVTTGTAIVVAASATRSGVDFKLAVPAPTMALDRSALVFAAVNTGAAFTAVTGPQTVRMTQTGSPAISWSIGALPSWLKVTPTSGSGSATLTVSVQFAAGLAATQAGAIPITLTGAGNSVGPIGVTLNSISAPRAPFGSFDTPTNGTAGVAGSIAVTGWALDDVAVTRVTICRDGFGTEAPPVDPNCAGNAKIYIGDALFVDGARTDI
jgi:hypothetical protein